MKQESGRAEFFEFAASAKSIFVFAHRGALSSSSLSPNGQNGLFALDTTNIAHLINMLSRNYVRQVDLFSTALFILEMRLSSPNL